jgi:UDP-N-acetylglucosamine 1-carboxyvinyltransferase
MMAASLAKGETVIENAAREPEVQALARLLNDMGAKISGAGTNVITIQGVARLHGTRCKIIPDRIETGTYLVAGAITGGDVEVTRCDPETVESVVAKLRETGCRVEVRNSSIRVRGYNPIRSVDISTAPYPGFPTDMQAQMMALMTRSEGVSVITETVFENRFMHVAELNRMGASVHVQGSSATVKGVSKLSGAPLTATDLRASASLVLAALAAEGESVIHRVYHLDRGYESLVEKLTALGADVRRAPGPPI